MDFGLRRQRRDVSRRRFFYGIVVACCLVGLGSNLGDRTESLRRAIALLTSHDEIRVLSASGNHATKPVGGPAGQAEFLNAAVRCETSLAPDLFLTELHKIEHDLERAREVRWSARTIDLDLLLYDAEVIETPSLMVPHPRMAFRRFVLIPATEIAGEMVHGPTGWSVEQLLTRLDTAPNYVALTGGGLDLRIQAASRVATMVGCRVVSDPVGTEFESYATGLIDPATSRQLEMIARRQLAISPQNDGLVPGSVDDFAMSDFWIGESLALARVSRTITGPESEAIDRTWNAMTEIRFPKLLILLGSEMLAPDGSAAPPWQAFQNELRRIARKPYQFPTLVLQPMDVESVVQETAAAVVAMQAETTTFG